MKTSLVPTALKACLAASLPVLLVGAPGVGKTDIIKQAADAAGQDLILSHPAIGDPSNVQGLPWLSANKKRAEFKPFGELSQALEATKPTVWFFDDLGQASVEMQKACMQLFLARQIGDHKIPDCITFMAATNGRAHKAGVMGMLEPVKSRFASIIDVEVDLDAWVRWAFSADVPPEVISFLRFRTELIHKFEATLEMQNSPSPRTWANVGKLLAAAIPAECEMELFKGAVGEAAAVEFTGYLKVYRSLPNLDAILLDPAKAKIPDEVSQLWAISVGLAARATEANFGRIETYAQRLMKAEKPEFSAVLIRDCVRKCPDIANTPEWTRLMASDLGQLLTA